MSKYICVYIYPSCTFIDWGIALIGVGIAFNDLGSVGRFSQTNRPQLADAAIYIPH